MLCRKVAAADEYRISPEELQRLNTAVFDETDPAKALQLGTFVSMISNLLLRPSQGCRLTRNSLFVSKELHESASFGQTDLVDVVSKGQSKSGSIVDEHLFVMHQFDPAAFNPMWWLSAHDVYLNDVKLSQQPYTAHDGPFFWETNSQLCGNGSQGHDRCKAGISASFPSGQAVGAAAASVWQDPCLAQGR